MRTAPAKRPSFKVLNSTYPPHQHNPSPPTPHHVHLQHIHSGGPLIAGTGREGGGRCFGFGMVHEVVRVGGDNRNSNLGFAEYW